MGGHQPRNHDGGKKGLRSRSEHLLNQHLTHSRNEARFKKQQSQFRYNRL